MKVTNNHVAPLNVAGVDIRSKATAEVDDGKFQKWSNGHAAKQWLAQELITTDAKGKAVAKDDGDKEPTEREKLMAEAKELKLDLPRNISNKDLQAAVASAKAKTEPTEREKLMAEAKELGLNPNTNTSDENLKKMIAEKKGS